MIPSFTNNLVTIFTVLTILTPLTSFSQSWANDNGGVYNIPAEEYNPTFNGYGSTNNVTYNKIDLQNGEKMEIENPDDDENKVPLYDYLGNEIAEAWNSPIGRDIGNVDPDSGYTFRDGGIIAASIAQIKVGNTNHTMAYAWSVNTSGQGRRSGWIKLTDLTPSNTIKNILEDTKEVRMDILEDAGINNAIYDEYKVVSAFLPSDINEYYLDPGRSSKETAGKARYYYTVEEENGHYISGIKNIPETSRQRYGVANNNIPIDAKFYQDRDYDIVKVDIYPPDSYNAESHQLELVWGYTIANSNEKIYSFINRRTLQATGNNDVTGNSPDPDPEPEAEPEPEPVTNNDEFTPDPNKEYYIDNPAHNLRLASTGESEDAYTTSTSTTNDDVRWKFVAKGNDYWHIQRANGGAKPRLRSDNSSEADMQETSYSGIYTYYHFPASTTSGTFYASLPDGPSDYRRLQITNSGDIKMVSDASQGTWVSFKFTEASSTTSTTKNIAPDGAVSQSSTILGASASRAIDKNTNGVWSQSSVTHTANERRPHWEVKWNDIYEIDEIKIYNRTDCCTDRLSDFKVYVIDDDSGDITFTKEFLGEAGSSLTVNTGGVKGNRVKIRLNGTNILSLAEVEVYGALTSASQRSSYGDSFLHAYKEMGRKVALNWMVDHAQTPIQYEIEHSKGDDDFELLETISANQDNAKEVYSFLHRSPEDGQNTYRVKVIFQDDSEFYLNPYNVNYESNDASIIFPNPTEGQLFVDLSEYMEKEVDIFMTDFSGKVQLTKKLEKGHEQTLDLDISAFKNGFYMLYIKGENHRAKSEKVSLINSY